MERQLQLCLNRIQKWAMENGFKFSSTKTVCLHFCNLRKIHQDPELKLNGESHTRVQTVQVLRCLI